MRSIRIADPNGRRFAPPPAPPQADPPLRLRDLLATIPILLLIPAILFPLITAPAATAQLQASPGAVSPGTRVTITGTGFASGERGQLTLDGAAAGLPGYRANGRGKVRVSFVVAEGTPAGRHTVATVPTNSVSPSAQGELMVIATAGEPEPTAEPSAAASPTAAATGTPPPAPDPTPAATPPPAPDPTPAPTATAPPPAPAGPTAWGMMGGYTGINLADLYRRGVRVVMVEMNWSTAEPSEGAFDGAYFQRKRVEIASYRAAGFSVVLNYGLHNAPGWLLSKQNARFVNQHGTVYTGSPEPNLVFAIHLRSYGERYTARVFKELGTDFFAVRIGGGHWGELTYPQIRRSDGQVENFYWGYGAAADATRPTGAWKPGQASPNNEARRFLDWYLQSLTDYQNWQIATVRRSFGGTIAPLYASWGMRAGDFDKAVATNLNGTSPAESNGETVAGFDHARHIRSITTGNVAVWATWGEKQGTISWLASLAAGKGFRTFAENSGHDSVAQMDTAMSEARRNAIQLFMWVRAETAYCQCGWATIDDYAARIASP